IARGHLARGRALIEERAATGELSAFNLECLRIRIVGVEERWGEILARPGIDDLVTLRLPRHAAAALIEAVYHVFIESKEDAGVQALVDLFADRVRSRFGRLFRSPNSTTSEATRKAWMLSAA